MNKEELNNLKVGECFTIGNKKFKILKGLYCDDCCFNHKECQVLHAYNLIPKCDKFNRKDETNIHFVEEED